MELLRVRHGQHHGLDQLLDLLVQPAKVLVAVGRLLVNLEGADARVVLGR
jgi:hypothetical protein